MPAHFRTLAWRILWTEEPGGLHGGHKESDVTEVSQQAWLQARVGGTELGYNMNLIILKK